jgi:hypothetical protein
VKREGDLPRRILALWLLSGCAGCVAPAELTYEQRPQAAVVPLPEIAQVVVIDARDVPDRYVGAVMGMNGKPLKTLRSPMPVAEAVAAAFRRALATRGDMAPPPAGRYDLEVMLLQLNAEQDAERQGEADMVVRLVDRATGREVYSTRTYAESRGDNYLAVDNDVFGSPAALTRVANAVLDRAITETVDKPGFRTALR